MMFKTLADDTAILLITYKIIDEDKREAYAYGLELFFEKIFLYGIIFIIAVLTKTLLFSLLFTVAYKMLRQYTGGFHCKTAGICMVVSVLLHLIVLSLYLFHFDALEKVLAASTFVSAIIIYIFSPIESNNCPLEIGEKKKYKVLSILVASIVSVVILISYKFNITVMFYSSSCALTADAVMLVISLRRCKNEERDAEGFGDDG